MKINISNKTVKISSFGIISAYIISLCIFTQSCSNEFEKPSEQPLESLIIPNECNEMGVLHNKGLDYIYEALKNSQRGSEGISLSNINTSTMNDIIKSASVSFVKTECDSSLDKEKLLETIDATSSLELLESRSDMGTNITPDIYDELFTDNQKYFINKYKEVISSLNGNIGSVIVKLNELDQEIISNCTPEEAMPLLACTEVGKYSLIYWNENLNKWAELFEHNVGSRSYIPVLKSSTEVVATESDWSWFGNALKEMGTSDGIGGLIGAGLGSLAGGVGAIPGGIAGACSASAGAGIKELLKKWGVLS